MTCNYLAVWILAYCLTSVSYYIQTENVFTYITDLPTIDIITQWDNIKGNTNYKIAKLTGGLFYHVLLIIKYLMQNSQI